MYVQMIGCTCAFNFEGKNSNKIKTKDKTYSHIHMYASTRISIFLRKHQHNSLVEIVIANMVTIKTIVRVLWNFGFVRIKREKNTIQPKTFPRKVQDIVSVAFVGVSETIDGWCLLYFGIINITPHLYSHYLLGMLLLLLVVAEYLIIDFNPNTAVHFVCTSYSFYGFL